MNVLPNELVILDNQLKSTGVITRLETTDGAIAGKRLEEAHYDQLIVANRETVASALRGAGVIGDNSSLLHLGKILHIDALFAEIDHDSNTFRRFVIVEDKLYRNPEAHRDVLGQVLDYAKELHKADVESLSKLLGDDHKAWLAANEDLVAQALRESDFLLLVCGDQIRPRLVNYVQYFKKQLDPLVGADIALLSMAIFSNGTFHVLIPHVVAIVTSERDLTIRVVVQNPSGDHLPASVELDQGTGPIGNRRVKIELDASPEQDSRIGR